MKETFKSFVELLISIALDEDLVTALEKANGKWLDFLVPELNLKTRRKQLFKSSHLADLSADELLLPHMKRVDGMITDNRKRLLHKLHIGQVLKVCTCNKICN